MRFRGTSRFRTNLTSQWAHEQKSQGDLVFGYTIPPRGRLRVQQLKYVHYFRRFRESLTQDAGFTQPFEVLIETERGVGVIPNPHVAHGRSPLSIRKWVCDLLFPKNCSKKNLLYFTAAGSRGEGKTKKRKGELKSRICPH